MGATPILSKCDTGAVVLLCSAAMCYSRAALGPTRSSQSGTRGLSHTHLIESACIGTLEKVERWMTNYRYVLCDVFTDEPLTGNPLAVFTRATGLAPHRMQAIAREMNLSETVFVEPPQAGGHAKIRIFTPRREVPFAGHPVLGTAVVLGGALQAELVRLETGVGSIDVILERDGAKIVFGWMHQTVPEWSAFEDEASLLGILGVEGSCLPVELYLHGMRHVLVTLDAPRAVSELCPNLDVLAKLPVDCVSVFAGSAARYATRVFAPAHGVPEDPATGSAAGLLAWHLVRHERESVGTTLTIAQGAALGRPATLFARVEGEAHAPTRLVVGGPAVVVGRGELVI